ncbi:MAG: hypothetical protein ACFE89_04415 [Candidatus Hodarchaeota archaeon]
MSEDDYSPLKSRWLNLGIMLSLFLIVFITRLITTLAYPIEVGIDGAYYTINVLSLITEGLLFYDAPIFSFAVAAFFTLLFGGNVILAVKITSAVFAGLLTVGLFYAGYTLTGNDWRAGLIAGILGVLDVSMLEFSTSLVKNEAALAFLPFAVAFLYRYMASGHKTRDLLGFLITGILTVLSHLMTVAWLFATVIAILGYESIKALRARQGFTVLRRIVIPLGAIGLCFVSVYLFFDIVIPAGNTWYTSSSLWKAANYSSGMNSLEAMVNMFGLPLSTLTDTPMLIELSAQLSMGLILFLAFFGAIFLLARNRISDRILIILFLTNFLMGVMLGGWSFRFQLMCFLPAYLIIGASLIPFINKITNGLQGVANYFGRRRFNVRSFQLGVITILMIAVVVISLPNFYWTSTEKVEPYVSIEELYRIDSLEGQFSEDAMLYAPHGVNYFITSRTGYETLPDWGDSDWPVYCAQKMFYDIKVRGRESYFVITTYPSVFSHNLVESDYASVVSVRSFDLIKNELNLTIITDTPTLHLYSYIRKTDDHSQAIYRTLTQVSPSTWNTTITLNGYHDGMYEVFISPRKFTSGPVARNRPWAGFYIYHFSNLARPQVHVSDLLYRVWRSGDYQAFTVNQSIATECNLLDLRIHQNTTPDITTPIDPYMLAGMPFFFLPYEQFSLPTFVLILILCPLNAIYLMTLAPFLLNGTIRASLQLHRLLVLIGKGNRRMATGHGFDLGPYKTLR